LEACCWFTWDPGPAKSPKQIQTNGLRQLAHDSCAADPPDGPTRRSPTRARPRARPKPPPQVRHGLLQFVAEAVCTLGEEALAARDPAHTRELVGHVVALVEDPERWAPRFG
jgi:hypothetical protein